MASAFSNRVCPCLLLSFLRTRRTLLPRYVVALDRNVWPFLFLVLKWHEANALAQCSNIWMLHVLCQAGRKLHCWLMVLLFLPYSIVFGCHGLCGMTLSFARYVITPDPTPTCSVDGPCPQQHPPGHSSPPHPTTPPLGTPSPHSLAATAPRAFSFRRSPTPKTEGERTHCEARPWQRGSEAAWAVSLPPVTNERYYDKQARCPLFATGQSPVFRPRHSFFPPSEGA